MENLTNKLDSFNAKELTHLENLNLNGGGFAYDAGFFFREAWISISNGGGLAGAVAVTSDLASNYRPIN